MSNRKGPWRPPQSTWLCMLVGTYVESCRLKHASPSRRRQVLCLRIAAFLLDSHGGPAYTWAETCEKMLEARDESVDLSSAQVTVNHEIAYRHILPASRSYHNHHCFIDRQWWRSGSTSTRVWRFLCTKGHWFDSQLRPWQES